jgi:uncharacterized membrane protein YoaK (UPF0700 family)
MTASSRVLRRWARRQRTALRVLLMIAAIALLIDGFWVERSVLHLLLLHPMLLLALFGALVLTEEPDPLGTSDGR